MNFHWVAEHFNQLQFLFLGIILFIIWNTLKSKNESSNFKSREANRNDLNQFLNSKKAVKAPLSLPGISLSGPAHEILGVDSQATESEIIRGYKEKIKLYHPDRMQGLSAEQIKFYEETASKINLAKESMLSRLKK